MLPPASGLQYYNESFKIYPYSLVTAANYLEAANFKMNTGTGYRYWDLDDDDIEDQSEWVELKFIIRSDDAHRNAAGNHLADALNAVGVRVDRLFMDITGVHSRWLGSKDAHLYTAGWTLSIEPDSIALWMGDAGVGAALSYYWHPGICYNTGYANDATFNINARIVEIANSEAEAVAAMEICNMQAARQALNGPMWVYSATQANARAYVGGTPAEEEYVDEYWDGMVMMTGYGEDNYFSLLNMHPRGHPQPADGTIRYGFKTTDIRSFNTLYASWVWDTKILNLIYDPLVISNPYNLNERLPWIVKQFIISSYEHPTLGTCSKATFTLRDDVYWSDGQKLTTADVYFTLVESWRMLQSRGLPSPWWISAVKSILSFSVLDPLNFEVLVNVKSIWVFGLTGATVRIMPEHIWRPIMMTATPAALQGPSPDPNLISSGAWRFREYVASSHCELVANKPGRTVTTSLPGATPVLSPKGFFRYYPKYVDVHADDYRAKIALASPNNPSVDVHLTVTDENLLRDTFTFTYGGPPNNPVGQEIVFEPSGCVWIILQWLDGNPPDFPPNGVLSTCDLLQIQGVAPVTPPIWVHIQTFNAPIMHVGQVLEAIKSVWIDTTPLIIDEHEFEKPGVPLIELFTVTLPKGFHVARVVKAITTEWLLLQDNAVVSNPWHGAELEVEWPVWITIPEDIAGSYYINPYLIAPDFFVEIQDVATAAFAFGAYPGHPRWSTIADLNGDYFIDIQDIASIAFFFGW
jgi:ABC-type transport system substrate-binding protein